MPINYQKTTWVMDELIRYTVNKVEVCNLFNKSYAGQFNKPFAVGEKIYQKLPLRPTIREGMKYTPQSFSEKLVEITMDQPFGVDYEFDAIDVMLNQARGEDIVRKEFIEPFTSAIVGSIERRCVQYAMDHTPNVIGALGTTPTTLANHHAARAFLKNKTCPEGGEWGMVLSPSQHTAIASILNTLNPVKEVSDAWRKGTIGGAAGLNWKECTSLIDFTAGTMTAADVTVSATVSDGATSIVLASASVGATLKKGDIINFTTPMDVNPAHKGSIGSAKTVILQQDCTIVGGSTATAYFEPALYGPGTGDQNISVLPTAGHVIVLHPGTTTPSGLHGVNGLVLTEDAFAIVFGTFKDPKSGEKAITRRDSETGISISYWEGTNFETRATGHRFDVMIGFGTLRPEISAIRMASLL